MTGALALAAESNGGGISGGVLALIGVFLGALVTGLTQYYVTHRTERAADRRARAEFVTKQLDELYGPLRLLTAHSKVLATKLKRGKGERGTGKNWNLLWKLDEVSESPVDLVIATEIMKVNERIEELLMNRAGLLAGDGIEPCQEFLTHYRLLRVAFDAAIEGEGEPLAEGSYPGETYPPTFDPYVEQTYTRLKRVRDELTGEGDKSSDQ